MGLVLRRGFQTIVGRGCRLFSFLGRGQRDVFRLASSGFCLASQSFFGFASGLLLGGLFLGGKSGLFFGFASGLFRGGEAGLFFGFSSGLLFGGPTSGLLFSGEAGLLYGFACGVLLGFASGLLFGLASGLFFGGASGLFLGGASGLLCGKSDLFRRLASDLRFCSTLGPQLSLLGVDRVPLG